MVVKIDRGRLEEFALEKSACVCLTRRTSPASAFDRMLEVSVKRKEINLKGQKTLRLGVALWHGGLPVDVLPAEGSLDIALGDEQASWPIENS